MPEHRIPAAQYDDRLMQKLLAVNPGSGRITVSIAQGAVEAEVSLPDGVMTKAQFDQVVAEHDPNEPPPAMPGTGVVAAGLASGATSEEMQAVLRVLAERQGFDTEGLRE